MGNIGDKLFLVIFGAGNFAGHIRKGGREIAHLIFAFHGKFIVHVAAGILFRRFRDFAQRNIDHFREENQNNQ